MCLELFKRMIVKVVHMGILLQYIGPQSIFSGRVLVHKITPNDQVLHVFQRTWIPALWRYFDPI